MFGSAFRIATVWGIPIKIHMSLIVVLSLIALSMGLSGGPIAILFILALEVGVFTSIALHELGHSFVAIRKGCRVREITLMFIGGAAQMEELPSRPRDEFQMAVAGPAVSILLGFLCWNLGGYLPLPVLPWLLPIVGRIPIRCNIVQFVGVINFGLAFFNLLPSFPMDGGRVMRALLTPKLGRLRATFIAARLGKIMAFVFGLYGFFSTPTRWIMVAIAFFIYIAAGNEYKLVRMQEAAKRHGEGFWSPFSDFNPERGEDHDQVTISPPPYEDGPDTSSEIRATDEDNPFKRLFGR